MLKKVIALVAAAAAVLSLAACGENTELFKAGVPLETNGTISTISKDIIGKYETKTICTYDGKDYIVFEYGEKQVLARIEKSGHVKILFEYSLDTVIEYDLEATKRSGKYIYFTKKDSGAEYASLCAVYLPTHTQFTIVDTPCSNMVLLDAKENDDMYAYGVIVSMTEIAVIDLKQGKVSNYSKTPAEIGLFVDVGDSFFALGDFGAYTESMVEAKDKDHVVINIIEKNKKGEVKSEFNFTFNPSNGVASN